MNAISEYEKRTQKLINIIFAMAIIYIYSIIMRLFFWEYKNVGKLDLLGDIDGVNIVVGVIAISACLLYYYVYKEAELFVLIFIYLSIWMEYVILNATRIANIEGIHVLFTFIVRIALMSIAIRSNKVLIYKIEKNKLLFSIIYVIISVLVMIVDIKVSITYGKVYAEVDKYIGFITIIYYYYLLYRLYKMALRKNRLIYAIFTSSIGILIMRRFLYITKFVEIEDLIMQCNFITFIGFIMLFIGLCADVVRSVRNEEKLYNEAKRNESLFYTINENVKEMIITVTKDEEISYINGVVESKLGYKKEEVLGRKIYDFIESEREVISDENGEIKFVEHRWICKDYSTFVTETIVNESISKYDSVEKIIVARDYAFRDKIKKLEKQYNEIKELEKIRIQFLANISHELRTPINIIYSCIQLLQNSNDNEERFISMYNKYEFTIKQNCYRMIRLCNNLVDIAKLDSGVMNMNFMNYDIVNLVENIALSVIPYVEEKDINIIFDTYIEELEIKCDTDSIERVILNLLSNAVKFTDRGGNIFVFLDADEKFVTISIKDDGIGIPEEVKEVIFERFVQVDKSLNRRNEGSGIGLALTKSLVELHNGKISLKSKEGEGSEFIIKLPNVKYTGDEHQERNVSLDSKPIDKVNIEFSDIYELY
ncbi:PAS domain-containing sensor histidine kinase [Clostridium bornimense]|uniref:PAS domain-containing sensor histidine kinase n=1 Tax=Clostridium bornimense TaxID=1216932 RepID=UPI001C0F6695|nr:PAS domain-containing sensor histidine kinase [Clostridium bornimense]MBU5316745.1 PAS domain-containing sensor histidine kinase [Clostridium bornimense]